MAEKNKNAAPALDAGSVNAAAESIRDFSKQVSACSELLTAMSEGMGLTAAGFVDMVASVSGGQFCGVLHMSVIICCISQIQAEGCTGTPRILQRFFCSGRCNVPSVLLIRTHIHSLALSPGITDR